MRARHHRPRPLHGVALIEALVALAVMAFGLLAVAGVQLTLRQNADIAKQRSEAVRMAQEEIERWRAFPVLAGGAGVTAFDNLASGSFVVADDAAITRSASYTLTRSVDAPAGLTYKSLRVDVTWQDRRGETQSVRLSTNVHRVAPEIAGTVSVPTGPGLARRNPAIPPGTTRLDATTSGFRPPQPPAETTVAWIFNDASGLITVCTTTAATTAELAPGNIRDCGAGTYQLLRGFVNFATGPTAPTAAQAEAPPSASLPVTVTVLRTLPTAATVACFTEQQSLSVVYYCAVPVSTDQRWSGRAVVGGLDVLTGDPTLAASDRLRVCRYTRYADDRTVTSGTIRNTEHPLDYSNVNTPLANQNFLVIRAGDGTTPFACPLDDPSSLVDTTTWRHPLT